MPGMEQSKRTTSGAWRATSSLAAARSAASPSTWNSESGAKSRRARRRASSLSSAITRLMGRWAIAGTVSLHSGRVDEGASVVRVFVVDDHELVRRGLRDLFEADGSIVVVGEAATGVVALASLDVANVDVALLDVRLPDGDGVDVCREIRSRHPRLPCLMLTSYD